jgi:hypothetical protein
MVLERCGFAPGLPFRGHAREDREGHRYTQLDVVGQEGSTTFSHDGSDGVLAGKGTSLEPAAGFTFDTPMVPRVR